MFNLFKKHLFSKTHIKNNFPLQFQNIKPSIPLLNFNINSSTSFFNFCKKTERKKEIVTYMPNYEDVYNPYKNIEKLESNTLMKRVKKQEENTLSFKEFNFIPEIYQVLDHLKFFAPTSIQSVAIPKIMEKKHVFYSSQTGTGKTLTYILPILHQLKMQEKESGRRLTMEKRPRVIILVPSRELAQQVEEVCKLFVYDVPLVVESFYVGKKFTKEKGEGKVGMDILITTPERFKNHWDKNNIYSSKVSHIIVDELDTLLDAGNEELLKLLSQIVLDKNLKDEMESAVGENNSNSNNLPHPVGRQLIYASATLTPSIEKYLGEIFTNRADFVKIIDKSTNHNLANVKHEFLHVTDYDKYPTLLKILTENTKLFKQNKSIIIFCNNVSCARKTELYLSENNFKTACIHGDIPPLRRKYELVKFKTRKVPILVCTDLMARGLDFPFVFLVINFDFPRTLSDYLHRAGRTGRNGSTGVVISFYRNSNLFIIEKIQKAHQLNLPMEVEKSIYNLRKDVPNGNKLYPEKSSPKKKLTPGISERNYDKNNEVEVIKRLKSRKEALEKFKKKSENDRDRIIRKLNESNQRKIRLKNKKNAKKYYPFSSAKNTGKNKYYK